MSGWFKEQWDKVPMKWVWFWFIVNGLMGVLVSVGTLIQVWLSNAPTELTNVPTKDWLVLAVGCFVVEATQWRAYVNKAIGLSEETDGHQK